ncbi:MAG: hypothetical protein ABR526_09330 [Chthoniobacterales bacterium]
MDKDFDHVSVGLREVADRRDNRLSDSGAAIPPDRLQSLHAALGSRFPVETALRTAANQRDESLSRGPVLPQRVELLLHRRLLAERPDPVQRGASQPWTAAVQRFWTASRTPFTQLAAALALIVCAIGALRFGRLGGNNGPASISHSPSRPPFATQASGESAYQLRLEKGLLRKPGAELTLRVSTIELASLQPSLLNINRALLADRDDFNRGLPLDLPIRQMLIDGDVTATP